MKYRAEAANLQVLVNRIASDFLRLGYYYAKSGTIPKAVNPEDFDKEQIKRFRITFTDRHDDDDVQYVRLGKAYLLVARRKATLTKQGLSDVLDFRVSNIHIAHVCARIHKGRLEVRDGEGPVCKHKLDPKQGNFKDYAPRRTAQPG
ncbi:MAG: hypothetical protein CLLPBCKN_006453 [Chroococcidiopsis cubana SAG 39.79]|uniref:HTH LytTR-type domain-containing protein n=1 Tax=Chroococcidiopsis cubana SAG 39.79 TaxID=388085 RepID=A0AB37UHC4_9CYAN|nr:hypothetical protein [Chroococcidiopsis cubana]MDZ4877018.1 hypothetical protein [Chroococcidiopsis cubana SAG 39.79]PSB51666.1 hypothetical protein C7B79_36195 [Chroococcidiopsis cubana CCALA 043]RUT10761.1 hypothetical protein DSM107010_40010 [Chroococcidiopsis cubana SAG 39.79]